MSLCAESGQLKMIFVHVIIAIKHLASVLTGQCLAITVFWSNMELR